MAEKKQPVRTCIVCRAESVKKQLIRIVRTKSGEIILDKSGKAEGRGAYICNDAECISKMKKTKALSRAYKCEIGQEKYDEIEKEILSYDK